MEVQGRSGRGGRAMTVAVRMVMIDDGSRVLIPSLFLSWSPLQFWTNGEVLALFFEVS